MQLIDIPEQTPSSELDEDILSLMEQVETMLPSMLKHFQYNQSISDEMVLFISQAYHLTHI